MNTNENKVDEEFKLDVEKFELSLNTRNIFE